MPGGYRHPARDERCRLRTLKAIGLSNRRIAEDLGRRRSTGDRETARNGDGGAYCWKKAREKAAKRRSDASSKPRRTSLEQWSLVGEKPELGWSPEQVSGRLRKEGQPTAGHEWIYRHVRAEPLCKRSPCFPPHLFANEFAALAEIPLHLHETGANSEIAKHRVGIARSPPPRFWKPERVELGVGFDKAQPPQVDPDTAFKKILRRVN